MKKGLERKRRVRIGSRRFLSDGQRRHALGNQSIGDAALILSRQRSAFSRIDRFYRTLDRSRRFVDLDDIFLPRSLAVESFRKQREREKEISIDRGLFVDLYAGCAKKRRDAAVTIGSYLIFPLGRTDASASRSG